MPRKKYYKKRTYKKRNYNSNNKEVDLLTASILFLLLSWYFIYTNLIKDNIEQITFYSKIIIPILIIGFWYIYYYLRKKRKNKEQAIIDWTPSLLLELKSNIKKFKPLRNYNKEELYQTWLYWYLQNNYPDLKIEETKHYSRPDITIGNIAIEIKWPTNMAWLNTLADKINKYLPAWEYLFIVLFDMKTSKKDYEDKKREILENTIESKREKIFFIVI